MDQIKSSRLTSNSVVENPIFILGHWRSGTTFLHNLICQDHNTAFTTTYQSVFPNNLFAFQSIIKWFMRMALPEKRPGDGLPLRVNQPQEEEFALGNEISYSYYYWFYFPNQAKHFRDIHFSGKQIPTKKAEQWKNNYMNFVKRCLVNSKGKTFVSKNPPNTARIPWLLELFPDAKFIFIHRDPYDVFRSSKKFFSEVIKPLQFQSFTEEQLDEHILSGYVELHDAYFESRELIPKENLIELSFESLAHDPYGLLKEISNQFGVPDIDKNSTSFRDYITSQQKHKPSPYSRDSTLDKK
ncbi:MAG: sulfotransferase [Flammeovirgaceae bacterium]|nr:sulfotransferase [Flammeovirgaceae bacterium]